MEKTFQISSFAFIAAAAVFLWFQNIDAVFVLGVLGACCFFLGMRYEIKARVDRRNAEQRAAREQQDE